MYINCQKRGAGVLANQGADRLKLSPEKAQIGFSVCVLKRVIVHTSYYVQNTSKAESKW